MNRDEIKARLIKRHAEYTEWWQTSVVPLGAAAREVEAMIREAVDEALEAAAVEIEARKPSGPYWDDPAFYRGNGAEDENDYCAEIVRSHKGAE